MPDNSPFTEAELAQLPVHFRYLRRLPAGSVAELAAPVRSSYSTSHQTREYRAAPLYKPLSAIDYDTLLAFVTEY